MNKQSEVWYKLRGLLIAPLYILLIFCSWNEVESHWLIFPGFGLFCAGWFLRIWSQMHLHYRLKVSKILTTIGPYAYVRNPIYIGNTLLLVGASVLSELLWTTPLMIMCCAIVYTLTVRFEEAHLAERYGGPYLAYCKRVPRWCPRLENTEKFSLKNINSFIYPSIKAELHIFLLLVPFAFKELFL